MAGAKTNRLSTYTSASAGSGISGAAADTKKDLWSSLLDSVASGRRLPEKNIVLLGGSVESQRELVQSLAAPLSDPRRRGRDNSTPPVANSFALGYTYYDVLDTDQEDTLARVSLYTLTTPAPAFGPLLGPLLTPQSIPDTVMVILLDWAEPWRWLRQLREWILLLRTVLVGLSDECKETMAEVMTAWRDRGRGGGTNLDGTTLTAPSGEDAGAALPLGPGEWDDALGLPLCLVCQNAERMEILEKTQNWKEEDFDQVLQFLRTVLLRHGASLIYTAPSAPSQLPTLLHSSLGIHSLLKKQPLKPNVIDRDKIVVPPNWDSWGKIRVLREGFDVEKVSEGWSIDLEQPFPAEPVHTNGTTTKTDDTPGHDGATISNGHAGEPESPPDPEGSTVVLYEQAVHDPSTDALQQAGRSNHSTRLEMDTQDPQAFLAQQQKLLETYRQQNELEARENPDARARAYDARAGGGLGGAPEANKVQDHIGPVQFNVGGIQVDADDMVQRLRDRQQYASDEETPGANRAPEDEKMKTQDLQAFFDDLMNRRK